ncbi:glycosyltransferase [Enterococcus sp. AZ109]|uniref:glycosyltransferase n=1 Tax=Enterococcus sp. AZ109 TaxID=2774634 RepID=UPI003F21BFF8
METVDVSLLISIYMKEKAEYLKQCLDSVFNQTVKVKEIVLVLDGPITKELEEVVDHFISTYQNIFRVIPLETNQGLGTALAEGVKRCKYSLIARMDSDDIMKVSRIEKQYEEFINHPELSIVGSNIDEFTDSVQNIISRRIVPENNVEICEFSKKRNPFNHMTVMFKKDDILSVGNYQPMNGFEDYYLWARLLRAGYIGKNIQESLVLARAGKDMYTRRGGKKYFISGIKGRYAIYKAGLGSIWDFSLSSIAHMVVSLLPNKLRGKIYERKLRG